MTHPQTRKTARCELWQPFENHWPEHQRKNKSLLWLIPKPPWSEKAASKRRACEGNQTLTRYFIQMKHDCFSRWGPVHGCCDEDCQWLLVAVCLWGRYNECGTSRQNFTAVIQMFLMTLCELQISLSFIGKRLHLRTWKMTLFDHLLQVKDVEFSKNCPKWILKKVWDVKTLVIELDVSFFRSYSFHQSGIV